MTNIKMDRLQQQKTTMSSTSISQEQECEAIVDTGSMRQDSQRLDKDQVVFFQSSVNPNPILVSMCDLVVSMKVTG